MSGYAFLASASIAGGAITTYFFHRPALNKAGFKLLAAGGLQGIALQVAAIGVSLIPAAIVGNFSSGTQKEKEDKGMQVFFISYIVCALSVPLVAKMVTTRLGTPMEAFVNFAVSGVLTYVTADNLL